MFYGRDRLDPKPRDSVHETTLPLQTEKPLVDGRFAVIQSSNACQ